MEGRSSTLMSRAFGINGSRFVQQQGLFRNSEDVTGFAVDEKDDQAQRAVGFTCCQRSGAR